jgi:hypothetical protein
MKVGCGFVEKQIRENRYLYFWSFEGLGSSVRKVERYIGPAADPISRRKTLDQIEAYGLRARAELDRRIARWRRELSRP